MKNYSEITAEQLGRIVEETASEVYLFSADDFRFLMVNRGARDNLGFSMEDLRRLTPWDIKPEISRNEFLELVEPLISGATDLLDFETVHERSDGTRYDISVRLQLMQSEGKAVYYAAIRDISELKKTQEALQASNRRLDAILNNTTMAVFMMDERQHCAFMNAAAEQMTGFSLAETQGKTLHEVIHHTHPDGRHFPIEECAIDRAFPENNQTQGQEVFVHKDGGFYPVGFTASPVKDERGRTIGTIIEAHNIEAELEARKTEEQLRRSQKLEAVGQLTGGIAHDFNNLLTIIMGNVEALSEELADRPGLQSMANMALDAAVRGAEMTNRLLAFSRKQVLEPRVLDLAQTVQGIDGLLRRALPENIDIEVIRDDGLWKVEIDAGQFEAALLNLAINARDAMNGGGSLTIEIANCSLDDVYVSEEFDVKAGQYVMLAVRDTGHGISQEVIDHIFEPFFTTKGVGKGSGLGLSMIYGFVKQSGGHIRVYSEADHGTVFKLYFPRAIGKKEHSHVASSSKPIIGGQEVILVVEDDSMVRRTVVAQLKSLGYHLIEAVTGQDAIAILKQGTEIDLLFTDVIMPGGIGGRALADAAREITPDIRILFTSGYTENSIVNDGKLDHGVELLSKPYRRDELALKVRKVLDGTEA